MSSNDIEKNVAAEMAMQMKWVEIMRPKVSMLKFRLPYMPGTTNYLSGKMHLQVWSPRTSTETRLIIHRPDDTQPFLKRDYDHTWYSDMMFHFNTVTRTTYFEHDGLEYLGYDHCYDCSAELFILQQYLSSPFVSKSLCILDKYSGLIKLASQIPKRVGIIE